MQDSFRVFDIIMICSISYENDAYKYLDHATNILIRPNKKKVT